MPQGPRWDPLGSHIGAQDLKTRAYHYCKVSSLLGDFFNFLRYVECFWLPSEGRLTRDSQVVSLVIPRFPAHFFVKNSRKIVKIVFSDSRDQNKILKFWWFFYMTGISYMNPHFRAPRPLKPLKSRPQGQNLPGFLLRAHSDHRGPVSAQFCTLSCLFLTLNELKSVI